MNRNRALVPRVVRHLPSIAVAAAVLALGYNFFGFIAKYSVNVLFFDEWDFLGPLFRGHATLPELFLEQLGPHREGLGLVADKWLYAATNWNVRAESFMIGGFVFAAMLLALLLKRRLFGCVSYLDVSIPFMFLTLAQFETLIGTPNAAHSAIPLAMLMAYCLALLQRTAFLRYGAVLALNLFSIYTGFGVFLGIVTIGVFALECYWRLRRLTSIPLAVPAAALVVASASFGSFFIRYRFAPAVPCFDFPRHDLASYPRFMALMFSNYTGLRISVLPAATGAAILLCSAVVLAVQTRRFAARDCTRDRSLIVGVLLSFSMLFAGGAAVGRVCLGLGAADASRYATLLIPAFLGLYLYLLSISSRMWRTMAVGALAVLIVPNALRVPPAARWFAEGKHAWSACYLQTESIEHCDKATRFVIYPHPEKTGLRQKLEYLKQRRLSFYAEPAR